MKRWCFDNKNKKNNFLHTTHTIFFFIFSNHFFFSFFKFYFSNIAILFFITHISVGQFFTRFLDFFLRAPTRVYPRIFAPHFKNTRFTSSLPFSNCQTIQTIQNFQTIHTSPVQFWIFRTFQNVYLYISRFYHQQIVRIFIIFLN